MSDARRPFAGQYGNKVETLYFSVFANPGTPQKVYCWLNTSKVSRAVQGGINNVKVIVDSHGKVERFHALSVTDVTLSQKIFQT